MKSLDVRLHHTPDTLHPMHARVCEAPFVEREVLLEGTSVNATRTLLFYVEGDREAYEAALADDPGVADYETAPADGDGFHLFARAPNRGAGSFMLDAFDRPGIVVVPPVEMRSDRTTRLTVVGRPGDVQATLDALPDAVDVDVLRVGTYDGRPGGRATDRQREALAAARAVGYYDVPRTSGIEAVADDLGCAVSTASELLRRAEARLVDDALDAPG